jgi:hypothetical protein
MPIPQAHQHRLAYHFTYVENLSGILQNGLLSVNEQIARGLKHESIAQKEIQNRRATMRVTCGPGGVVHDYVPFYFCKRSSMLLAVINKKNVDQQFLIHLGVNIGLVEDSESVFTNASANTNDPPNFYNDPNDLVHVQWNHVDNQKYSLPEAEKQSRMAELLVYKQVPISSIERIIVWNDGFAKGVREVFERANLSPPSIEVDNLFHYTKYPSARNQSLVTGPYWTKRKWESAVKEIERYEHRETVRFKGIRALRDALNENFAVLKETSELLGLGVEAGPHQEDVGQHTLSVLHELRASEEFAKLNDKDQLLTELAAYLHDIGKGPKSRWDWNGGKYRSDRDHPLGSLEMTKRILTEEIQKISDRSARIITKLVCYHDLIGDIVVDGRDRDPEQLDDIIESEEEFDMLQALTLADMAAVNPQWPERYRDEIEALRGRVRAKLASPASDER